MTGARKGGSASQCSDGVIGIDGFRETRRHVAQLPQLWRSTSPQHQTFYRANIHCSLFTYAAVCDTEAQVFLANPITEGSKYTPAPSVLNLVFC
jgi:hypothetical protein